MPDIVAGKLNDLPFEIREGLGRYRYNVFVQRLGWSLQNSGENVTTEWDKFDDGDTIQVVALDGRKQICGCARLMPTIGRYLLQDLLPRSTGLALPSSPTVWELSRFAGSTVHGPSTDTTSGMALFPHVLAIAMSLGATHIIGTVSRAIARLYRRFGLDLRYIGSDQEMSTFRFLVCEIDLTSLTFAEHGHDPHDLLNAVTWFGSHALPTLPDMTAGTNAAPLSGTLSKSP